MIAIRSCALFGVEAFPVEVEVDVRGGALPAYNVVGLASAGIKEGAVRIRSALGEIGHGLPNQRITINLAPADRRKSGATFDLPIALGILIADSVASSAPLAGLVCAGELGLDGTLRPMRGALSAALLARRQGQRGVLVPRASAAEAAVVDGIEVYCADHLGAIVAALRTDGALPRFEETTRPAPVTSSPDLADVRGQEVARAALELAVAGGHNLIMVGPPGIGKTMLARRIPGVLPPMSRDEAIETTQVYSAAGLATDGLIETRPFRAPHHSISTAALVGGGRDPGPGEISLAHNGVLFLDELPEFRTAAIESMRQPLEDRCVTIGRVSGTARLPASFLLVASANPCPCGWSGSLERSCVCSPTAVHRYRRRMSGPLLDRIDLQVFVPNVGLAELRGARPGEASAAVRERVMAARDRQARRLARFGVRTNAAMSPRTTRATCKLDDAGEATLARLYQARHGMTARTVDRIIKMARTVADLRGLDHIDAGCLREAASYRALDNDPVTRVGAVDQSSLYSSRERPPRSKPM